MIRGSLLLLVGALFLGGCGQSGYPPEAINPEVDVCEVCNMSIIQEEFASQAITKDGTSHKFDDIGCLMEFLNGDKAKEMTFSDLYVREYGSDQWIRLEQAYHVYHRNNVTPMAYGVVSFGDEAKAKAFLQQLGEGGELYDWEKLKQHKWGQ